MALLTTRGSLVVSCVFAGLVVAGCGGGHTKPSATKTGSTAPASPTATTSSPPPTYTADQVVKRLLSAKDIGPKFKATIIGTRALIEGKAIMCSQSGVKLPGKPTIGERQYTASVQVQNDQYYSQFVTLYADSTQAAQAFAALKTAAQACPPKQHVAARKDSTTNATLFSHDDTWTLSPQDEIQGWTHLHGWEREVYQTGKNKQDITYDAYDYSVRGNLLISTLYAERTIPQDKGDAIAQRASTVLLKQLRAFG